MSSYRLRRIASIASSVMLAVMLLGPSGALAATPSVAVGSTSESATGTGASPTVVSIGDTVRFQTTLQNTDSSTISQLYVQGFTDASIYTYGTPTTYAVSITKQGLVVNNGCAAAADLGCVVRNVKPLDKVQVTVVYKVPRYAPGSTTVDYAGQPSCDMGFAQGFNTSTNPVTYNTPDQTNSPDLVGPAVCVHFVWSTSGNTSSDGRGTSHGDVWSWYDGAVINPDLTNFRSRWVEESGQFSVENTQTINAGNPHSTKAFAPIAGIPVTVQDVVTCPPAPALCEGLAGFGQVSHVDVAGGFELPGVTWYHFLLQADSSEIANGTNQNNVVVNHNWTQTGTACDGSDIADDVTVTCTETIVDRCTMQDGEPTNAAACIVVKKLAGNDLRIDVWTFHNGGLRLA